MSVNDVSTARSKSAWLLDFSIDSCALKQEHRNWLNLSIIRPLRAEHDRLVASNATSSDAREWIIWLIGNASRTGSFDYNQALSQRRAEAVRRYLHEALAGTNVVYTIETRGLSELRATLLGARDETEDMTHRAVYVVMEERDPTLPPNPPVVKPPERAVPVSFYLYADRGAFMNVMKWRAELYAIYRRKGGKGYVGWLASASALTTSPSDVNKAFTPPLPSIDKVFAGPARITLPDVDAIERLNGATIWPRMSGATLRLRIENAAPDRGDLHLKLPVHTGNFELTQGVGSLKKMQTLSPKARESLDRTIWNSLARDEKGRILA